MFIGEGHKDQKTFMDAVKEGYRDGILEQQPTLVNLQCDVDHPTQCMADMLHIIHEFGGVENLKGKKIAIDVYKRQDEMMSVSSRIPFPRMGCSLGMIRRISSITAIMWSVSYTHLDVYKRQVHGPWPPHGHCRRHTGRSAPGCGCRT